MSSSVAGHDPQMPEIAYDALESSNLLGRTNLYVHGDVPPERRLMVAIFRDAMRCIEKYRNAHDRRGKRLFALERDWLLSNDTSRVHAFRRVCESLDLDPGSVRRSLGFVAEGGGISPLRLVRTPSSVARTRKPTC